MDSFGIIIKGIVPLTTVDYKGKAASTIFLQGCNFRCPFCHNPELVPIMPSGEVLSEKEILGYLSGQKGWIDAICISGGEPTLHKGLPEFIRKLKARRLLVKLQTNGTNPQMLKALLKENLLNYISMDIKAPKEKYALLSGTNPDMDKLQESIDAIMSAANCPPNPQARQDMQNASGSADYSFHTTVSPELSIEDIKSIGLWLNGAKRYVLQQFRPEKTLDEAYEKRAPHAKETLQKMADSVKSNFKEVIVEGIEQ